jgi:putative aminopeptidase FrvX
MTELLPFLKELLSASGLSGYESPAARIIADTWKPLVDELSFSKLGSLHGLKRASLPLPTTGADQKMRPSVMVATHMDSIGLMVTTITDGFLHVAPVGGVDVRILPGTPVNIFASGKNATGAGASGRSGRDTGEAVPLPGVVVLPAAHLLPEAEREGPVPLAHLLVDTGLQPRQVSEWVRPGDLVSFAQAPMELSGEALAGHSLDNRASVAALTVCLQELQNRPHSWDVWAVASSQEEVGAKGAEGSAFELRPSIALVVDVTFAKGPGASDWSTFPLGKGPTIVMGPNIHPALYKAMQELADKREIPHGLEYTPRHSGTDGVATQVVAEGIPTLVVGIPLRYMHTPVEMVALKDIQRAGRLLAEFIAGLEVDFLEKIVWDV